jgi:hypothetical protein
MAGKQFSPFMEMVVQPCLTDCATASYNLYNCVLRFIKWLASSSSRLWKWLCNCVLQNGQLRLTVYGNGQQAVLPFMEMVVQLCLTEWATPSYCLRSCVLRLMEMVSKQFSPFMETVLEVVRAKISGYIKS